MYKSWHFHNINLLKPTSAVPNVCLVEQCKLPPGTSRPSKWPLQVPLHGNKETKFMQSFNYIKRAVARLEWI